jgi:hypothetical protein
MAIAALALLARLLYVQYFSTPMPYWDQWDGEWATALKPWMDGTLQWQALLAPHNEHRILPTRLLALLSYAVTGQWNNVYEARIGALLFCLIPGLLVWHALRDAGAAAGRWLLLPLALLLSVLPFTWENFLVGFQTQFYVLVLSSIVSIALAARHHQRIPALLAAIALSAFATTIMASGMLTAVATAAACVLACLCLPGRRGPALCAAGILVVMAVAAYAWVPVIEVNAGLRAQGVGEFLYAASRTLAWPMRSGGFALIIWLPATVMILRMVIRRQASATELVMAGLCIWSALQALAIAYGRGHGLRSPMPRYMDLFVPGLFANAWFAIQLWGLLPVASRLRTASRAVAVLFAVLVAYPLLARTGKDVEQMREFTAATRVQQHNVQRYLATGEPSMLQVGEFELPYPDPARLKVYLDDPALRRALPPLQQTDAAAPQGAGSRQGPAEAGP